MRAPFITNVTDNIVNRQKDTILSAYAVGKLFTGVTIASLDLNTYVAPGVIRIDSHAENGPTSVPTKGFLHVTTLNQDEDVSADQDKYIIRQVLYPDNNEHSTQTRVGVGYFVGDIVWSDWTEMGGGFLKRIKLDHNMTGVDGDIALPNTMYYSYGNYTLILPNPNNYRFGTRIGLEQMANPKVGDTIGMGTITCGNNTQLTVADYKVIINEETGELIPTDELLGSVMYVMTVSDINGVKEWVLEVSNSVLELVSFVNNRITAHMEDANDPHKQYLKKSALTSTVLLNDQTIDKAVTPKGVANAISGADNSNTFVAKQELYTNPASSSPTIKNDKLPVASTTTYGAVRMATDVDITTPPQDAASKAVNPLQLSTKLSTRRLVHKGEFIGNDLTITADIFNNINPLYAMTNSCTINLPKPTSDMVEHVATVYIDVINVNANVTVTVKCPDLSLNEAFINTKKGTTLQLVFEASYGTDSNTTHTWKLVL